jgi:hypothetical protein
LVDVRGVARKSRKRKEAREVSREPLKLGEVCQDETPASSIESAPAINHHRVQISKYLASVALKPQTTIDILKAIARSEGPASAVQPAHRKSAMAALPRQSTGQQTA